MPPKTHNPPGRPRSFDQDEIVSKVMLQFFQHGYAGTTSRRLQSATGLSAPSLYNVFGSKRELFLSALRHYSDSGIEYLFAGLAKGNGGIDDLRCFLDRMWRTLESADPPMGCLVLNTRGEFGTSEPDILTECNNFTRRQVACLRLAFERAAALGEIPHDAVDSRLMSFRLMLNGIQHLVRTNGIDHEVRAAYATLRATLDEWQGTSPSI